MKTSLNRALFKSLIKKIKKKHSLLKIKVYKAKYLPGGSTGEYGWGSLNIASGSEDWSWIIGTLAHEYCHFLRETRHSVRHSNNVYRQNGILYDPKSKSAERLQASKVVGRDEYQTDIEAYRMICKWGIQEHFQDWFYWANIYNYKIKYLTMTGVLFSDIKGKISCHSRQLTPAEIVEPLTDSKFKEIDAIVMNEQVEILMRDFKVVKPVKRR